MAIPFTSPQLNKSSFNCPHCKAFSNIQWSDLFGSITNDYITDLKVGHCIHCEQYSVWVKNRMVFPDKIDIDSPNKDLPEDIQGDYLEAASILNKSPRGAAALLRLAIEKLVNSLDAQGKDLNAKIGDLVTKGLSPKIQKALDIVRVIGNESVHPGQIDVQDNPEIAQVLFRLVNIIADDMVTKPKEVDSIYNEIVPENHKDGIENRDSK